MVRRAIQHIVIACFFVGCGQNSSAAPSRVIDNGSLVTVRMLAGDLESYLGYSVIVRGYLISNGPELNLTVDKDSAAAPGSPYIVIYDASLVSETDDGRVLTAADELESLGCTNQYVELSGIVGRTVRGPIGIVKVLEVSLQGTASIDGGNVCYAAE